MFAAVAFVLFLLVALGVNHAGPVNLIWLGVAFVALHLAIPGFFYSKR